MCNEASIQKNMQLKLRHLLLSNTHIFLFLYFQAMVTMHIIISLIFVTASTVNAFDIVKGADRYQIMKVTSSEYAQILCRYHTIRYEIELKAIDEINEQISTSTTILKNICQNVRFNHICLFTLNEIKILSDSFASKNKVIQSLQVYSRKRRTMGDLATALQRTVELAETTYNDLRSGVAEMQSLVNMLRKSQNKLFDSFDYTNFYSLAQLTAMNLKNLLHITNAIIDLFVNNRMQKIIELVPIEILRKNLLEINSLAGKENCKIPFNVNLMEVSRVLKVSKIALNKKNQLLFMNIRIPTVTNSLFQIMKPIPLPFSHKNITYEAQPIYENYLILEEKYDITYSIPFSNDDKRNCVMLKSNTRMCDLKKAIQKSGVLPAQVFFLPEFENCEVDKNFLENVANKVTECNLKRTSNSNRIIGISPYEIYVYVTQPTFLQVNCLNKSMNKPLNSSVFIYNLESTCSLHISNAFITEHSNRDAGTSSNQINLFLAYSISSKDLMKKEPKDYNMKPVGEFGPQFNDLENSIRKINVTNQPKIEKIKNNYWWDVTMVFGFYSTIILCCYLAHLYYKYKQFILSMWVRARDMFTTAVTNV